MKRRSLLIAVIVVALAHMLVLVLLPLPIVLSNVIQLAPGVMAVGLCLHQARHSGTRYFARLWYQLGFAFSLWLAGQVWFLSLLLTSSHAPTFPSPPDLLWILFAFPMFLVTSNTQESGHDWVARLDIGQACTSVTILCVLIFVRPALIGIATAYEIQGLALFLAAALRYSAAMAGRERAFFRNLTIYLGLYAIAETAGETALSRGVPEGSIVDLAWTFPLLAFCALTLRRETPAGLSASAAASAQIFRTRLHGVGASSLGLMSIAAGGLLAIHRPETGLLAVAFGFLLFAARTSLRETQLHEVHKQLELSLLRDSLTGLANRPLLLREISRCLSNAGLDGDRTFGILSVDLDRFKVINDSLGHAYGDRLLQRAWTLIRSVIGPKCVLGRVGGDEFIILLENIDDAAAAAALASEVIAGLQMPLTLEGRLTYLSASIGIVLGTQASSGDELLRDADCAMYEAKATGRGRSKIFAPAMLARANEELLLETDLRHSLKDGALTVWYQPIYSASAGRICGFEALARWQHPTRGMVSPAEFIPLAEDTGLIIELGRQVLRKACAQIREWNERHRSDLTVSVNISARQFADPNLMDDIMSIVNSTGILPGSLKLEITESVLIGGLDSVQSFLQTAQAAGIEIYLDDFGTGYSSFSYLLDFPFDMIKIDRSFIRNLQQDQRRTEVVRMIVQLAKTLKKKVVAEGVETLGELDRLREIGCDLVQGFLFSKPQAPEIISALLAQFPVPFLEHKRADGAMILSGSKGLAADNPLLAMPRS